jgi:hypothetical protein
LFVPFLRQKRPNPLGATVKYLRQIACHLEAMDQTAAQSQ